MPHPALPVSASPDGLLDDLNPAQREAVTITRGPLCILAGAGTGKTRVISRRVAYAVATGAADPRHVLVVTFTEKAAGEMQERLARLGYPGVAASTFHAAALKQLRYFWPRAHGTDLPQILDSKLGILAPLQRTLPGGYRYTAAKDLAQEIEWAKARRIPPTDYVAATRSTGHEGPLPPELFQRLYSGYEDAKRRAGRIDFEDMLELTIAILDEDAEAAELVRGRYRWFSVDEYQDTNELQQALLDRWLGGRDDIAVVGDEDQTIYTFTGASSAHLLGFASRFPHARTVRIEENYRSTPEVLALANRLISAGGRPAAGASGDRKKRLIATHPPGPEPSIRGFDDAEDELDAIVREIRRLLALGVSPGEIAVLVRINAQLPPIEEALAAAGLPFRVAGERFFARYEVRQAMQTVRRHAVGARASRRPSGASPDAPTPTGTPAEPRLADMLTAIWAELGFDPTATPDGEAARARHASFATLLGYAARVEAAGPAELSAFVVEIDRLTALESEPAGAGVNLLTYHRAKGLEWAAVVLPALEEGLLPIRQANDDDGVAEERRLLYVGITRARRHLWLSWARERVGPSGKEVRRKPSRFLAELRPPSRPGPRQVPVHVGSRAASPIERGPGPSPDASPRSALSNALREWRLARARSDAMPPYIVLHDSTLEAIAERAPRTLTELRRVPGIGPGKLDKYGAEIVAVIAAGAAETAPT